MPPRQALLGLLTLLYPLVVYLGLSRFEPRWIALLLLSVAVLRALTSREAYWRYAAAVALMLALAGMYLNHATPLKLYPAVVSAAMLAVFALSLIHPPTIIERLARLQNPDLPASAIAYTRKVTMVWCGFFIVNGAIALATALYASDDIWALYNGLISYCLMGSLFIGERLIRPNHKVGAGDE